MLKGIKLGFGFTIGVGLANACVSILTKCVAKSLAKDKDFMDWEKENNPEMYEKIKEYS